MNNKIINYIINILFFITIAIYADDNDSNGSDGSNSSDSNDNMKLYVIDSGENKVIDLSVFSPEIAKGTEKTLAIRCYVIKHPKGILLWDTCLNDGLEDNKEGLKLKGGIMTMRLHNTIKSQLDKINISPADIDYVSFSHMHPDHSGNSNLFNSSTFIIQNNELDAAFSMSPEKYSFDKKLYKNIIFYNIKRIKGNYDVFNDGSVVILSTPGHTPGHQALYINLPKTGPLILSGDLYHFADNRKHKRIPPFNYSKDLTANSMEYLEKFVDDKKAKLWIQHDPDQEIKYVPNYYN